jgi:hypothetical protein
MAKKDLRKLLAELERQGFTVRQTSRGHWFVTKDGKPVTTFSGSASDHRSHANALAACRRAGFEWPRKG